MKLSFLVEVALWGTMASSLAFDAPLPTAAKSQDFNPPQPPLHTGPPILGRPELLKRDYEATVLIAPDNTCGFIAAAPSVPFYCGAASRCELSLPLYSSTGTVYGEVRCCDSQGCEIHDACVGIYDYASGTRCVDTRCFYCTSVASYCNYYTFAGLNVVGGYCDTINANDFLTFVTANALTRIQYSTEYYVVTQSIVSSAASHISSAATSSLVHPSATSSITTTTPPSSGGSSNTPVGAIAGGVVGGVAVLAIIGGIIFFLMRKKRREAAENAQPTGQAQQPPFNPNQGPSKSSAQQLPYNLNRGPPEGGQATYPPYMGEAAVGPASWEQTKIPNTYDQGYEMQNRPMQNEKAYAQNYVSEAGPPTHDLRG